jgi:hypothetical protein
MALMTPADVTLLTSSMPAAVATNLGQRLANAGTLQTIGRLATGHIRLATNPNDADTVTILAAGAVQDGVFLPGSQATYEFEVSGGVQPGNILVPRGATAALSAQALATAIQGGHANCTAALHPTDAAVVDVAQQVQGAALTLSTTGGPRVVVQANNEGLPKGEYQLYLLRRTVTAEDVARLRIRINTGLSAVLTLVVRLFLSATDLTPDNYNAAPQITGGIIELPQGTASGIFNANNIVELLVFGTL